MLDCLQECLESRCLPHYIMPQSNLLLHEDPSSLKEAAAVVVGVRCNIVPKKLQPAAKAAVNELITHTRIIQTLVCR